MTSPAQRLTPGSKGTIRQDTHTPTHASGQWWKSPTPAPAHTPTPAPHPAPKPAAPLNPTQMTASAIINQQLTQWGLGSLSGKVNEFIRQGYGQDAITLQLEQTAEYKQRFSANEARMKAGLPVLTPAQYVATEASYKQVLSQYGLPAGFHDQPSDLSQFIAHDISPSELNTRAQDAQAVWLSKDPTVKQAWKDMYGLTDGAAIASILDPDRALPVVQRMTTAAQIGGAALSNGLKDSKARFEQYADQGVTAAQAQKAFGQIAQTFDGDRQAAARAGMTYSQTDAEKATLLGSGAASAKQQQIYDSEKALFDGRGSADQNTLASRSNGTY